MSLASDAEVSGHTHQPLPLRSVLKQSSVGASAPATPITSPTNSPYITRVALPSVSASPAPAISSLVSASTLAVTLTGNAPQQYTSPPPLTPGYTPKVSFDTFENPAASMFSFTLSVKTDGYKRTRSTRVFLCASSPDESGREALDWALESLVQDGDELIVYRGVDEDLLGKVDHDTMRDEARDLMRTIQAKSAEVDSDRKLSLILEYIPGKITETLDRLIALYRPDSVVVGTRGRRAWQNMGMGIGMGSVSKYCLSHSPVPIIVVRPERKVKKAIEKRRADPKRGRHFEDARSRPSSTQLVQVKTSGI